jgi:hypothetical protein
MSIGFSSISSSPFSVKGSILVHNGTSTALLSVGANSLSLGVSTSSTNGLTYIAPSGDNNYFEPISTSTLTANATEINFTSIPSTYKDLMLIGVSRATSDATNNIQIQFNTDTSAVNALYNYTLSRMQSGSGSVLNSLNQNQVEPNGGICVNSITGFYGGCFMFIHQYANTAQSKGGYIRTSGIKATAGSPDDNTTIAGRFKYNSTSAISSIRIKIDSSGFASGTSWTLYGGK